MKLYVNEVELTGYEDRQRTFSMDESDLEQNVGVASFILSDVPQGVIPELRDPELAHGFTVRLVDDDNVTVMFRGRVEEVTLAAKTGRLDWHIVASDENARALETTTHVLDRSAVTSTDRDHLIALFTSAWSGLTFGLSTIDDAVYTANAPDWTGIRATSSFQGRNWSHLALKPTIDSIIRDFAPDARLRIRADRVVEYGPVGASEAPFVVGDRDLARGTTTVRAIDHDSYRERWVMGGHRNKRRLTGAAASEATATDESSYARIGRVLEEPYRTDTTIPSGEVRRIAYADLAASRRRRTFAFRVRDKGLVAGQAIAICNSTAPPLWRAAWPESLFSLMARSDSGVLSHMRGWAIVQKVKPVVTGVREYAYDVEAGDYVRDLPTVIADAGV